MVDEIPVERCELSKIPLCKNVQTVLPKIVEVEECHMKPLETCVMEVHPKQIQKPVIKRWCFPRDETKSNDEKRDCHEWFQAWPSDAKEGSYTILIGDSIRTVKCLDDGWTVVLSRGQFGNRQDYFSRNWDEYVEGFGNSGTRSYVVCVIYFRILLVDKEHWFGLENIRALLAPKAYRLRISMEMFDGTVSEAYYDHFSLGSDVSYGCTSSYARNTNYN